MALLIFGILLFLLTALDITKPPCRRVAAGR